MGYLENEIENIILNQVTYKYFFDNTSNMNLNYEKIMEMFAV